LRALAAGFTEGHIAAPFTDQHLAGAAKNSSWLARGTHASVACVHPAQASRALAADRVRNTAEYLAEFRSDISSFLALEEVEGCVGVG